MTKKIAFFIFLNLFFSFNHVLSAASESNRTINVGVYDNEPKIFFDRNNIPSGIFVDILEEIKKSKHWKINYIPCQWSECLTKLESGELDIMPDVAQTSEREKIFLFCDEVVLSSWSVLYKRKNVKIDSILDLHNKRVAVVSQSIQLSSIKEETRLFNIKPIIKEYESFAIAFEKVQANDADCVWANRFYGNHHYRMYDLEKTAILIKPAMLKFAFSKKNSELKTVVDSYLQQYKSDEQSIYYKSLQKLTDEKSVDFFPKWLIIVLFLLILILFVLFGLIVLFKKMVNKKTKELMETSNELDYLSKYDKLTGLLNRTLFIDRLEQTTKIAKRKDTNVAVLYFDLDNFHELNNALGNEMGDKALQYFADALKNDFREYDTISRFSSDEFIVIIENDLLESMLLRVIEDLEKLFRHTILINNQNIHLTFSAGIAMFPQDADNATELITKSNIALHTAKSLGRNNFQFYKKNMTEKTYEKLSLVSNLREAVEHEKLEVYFQPKVSVLKGHITGAEALLRWTHPELGVISPVVFIPLAEEHGLINQLGYFVLEESMKKYSQWIKAGLKPGIVAVNVSVLQLKNSNFIANLKFLMQKYNFDVKNLELELTESQLMTKTDETIEILQEISALGIKIAIDDFGTGYSSLSYLKRLPINILKIDRSFIKDIPFEYNDMEVTRAIIAIAKSLKLSTVAEGVETIEQLEFLKTNGCDVIKRYYYFKPMRADEFESILAVM